MRPENDMSKWSSAQRLLNDLQDRAVPGQRSLVWVALTCTPWCAWQTYNLTSCDKATVQRIEDANLVSLHMIDVLCR
eukprot:15044171-Heterocapsa_arctica.AAC.1